VFVHNLAEKPLREFPRGFPEASSLCHNVDNPLGSSLGKDYSLEFAH